MITASCMCPPNKNQGKRQTLKCKSEDRGVLAGWLYYHQRPFCLLPFDFCLGFFFNFSKPSLSSAYPASVPASSSAHKDSRTLLVPDPTNTARKHSARRSVSRRSKHTRA